MLYLFVDIMQQTWLISSIDNATGEREQHYFESRVKAVKMGVRLLNRLFAKYGGDFTLEQITFHLQGYNELVDTTPVDEEIWYDLDKWSELVIVLRRIVYSDHLISDDERNE